MWSKKDTNWKRKDYKKKYYKELVLMMENQKEERKGG